MSKKIIFCCLAMVVSIIPLISCSPAIALKDHHKQVQQMLRESPNNRSFEFPYDPILNSLCAANFDGDYQDPFFCNLIIKCSGRKVFIEVCPSILVFNPFYDGCTWPSFDNAYPQCPSWPSVWRYPSEVRCERIGQVQWSGASPVKLPKDPPKSCGRDYVSCKNFEQVGQGMCGVGDGYSKAFLACLPFKLCRAIDTFFNLI